MEEKVRLKILKPFIFNGIHYSPADGFDGTATFPKSDAEKIINLKKGGMIDKVDLPKIENAKK